MKFVIRKQEPKKEEETVEWWLEEWEGRMVIKAKIGDEPVWYICEISKDGLRRNDGLKKGLGFPVDDGGRIKLNE